MLKFGKSPQTLGQRFLLRGCERMNHKPLGHLPRLGVTAVGAAPGAAVAHMRLHAGTILLAWSRVQAGTGSISKAHEPYYTAADPHRR